MGTKIQSLSQCVSDPTVINQINGLHTIMYEFVECGNDKYTVETLQQNEIIGFHFTTNQKQKWIWGF